MVDLKKTICCFALMAVIGCLMQSTVAQEDKQRQSELGARQRLVERKMIELENQFTVMAEKLQQKEPERAKRLIEAYQQAKETLITRKMAEVSDLLDDGQLDEAGKEIEVVVGRLDELVRLLLNNQPEKMNKQEQIAQFEQWKKTIQDMRRQQTSQRKETNKVANKESELDKLNGQIKKLDDLIQQQRGLIDETKASDGAGLRAMDKVADKQFELRQETENLTDEIAGDISTGTQQGKPGPERAPSERGDSNERTPDQKNQAQTGDSSTDSPESKPSEKTVPSDQQQSGEQQSGEQQSGEQQSGEQQSGQSQDQTPQPGQQPLQQASKAQERAEENLGSGRPKDAERQQKQALADLEKARSELKKEHRRLASLPPEAVEEMARKQRRTRDKAMDLVEKMEKAPASEAGSDEQQVSKPGPQQQPGQQSMEQAAEAMENASQDLDDAEPQKAESQQRDAEKQLDEALDEIEERLNQLRDETREEKLRRLEGRFSEMLQRQHVASAMTIEIDDKKTNLGKLQRRDQLVVLRLASEEIEISELGQQAYDLLLEDGTSDVFPELVQDLIAILTNAGQLLQEERTDQLTQLLQHEIESALMDLLEALEESKEKGDGQSGGGGGGGDQPLLKRSAELKMLRAAQQRLNRKTRQLDVIKGSDQLHADQPLDLEIEGLSDSQAKLQEMAEKIMGKEN